MSTVGRQMATSAGWMISMRFFDRAIGFVSILILARLLVPADFGLVAMATTIVALLDAMTAFGFEWAVIQRQSNERRILDTAWTLNVIIGLTNAALLLLLIPLIVAFFDEPRLAPVAAVFALSLLLGGTRNVGMVQYERDLAFGRIFALTLVRRLAGFGVTLAVALSTGSYWALVLGSLAAVIADLAMSYLLSPYRPRFTVAGWRDIMTFSRWLYVANVLGFVNARGTHLLIGRISGASALGTYNVAYELGALPTSELILPAFRAMFPGYSKLKNDPAQLTAMFSTVMALTMLAVAPAAVGIIVLAEPIVDVLLGNKWLAVIPLLQVFGVVGAIHAFDAPANALNLAIGRPDVPAKLALTHAVVALPLFGVVLATQGLVQAAMSLVVVGAVIAGITMVITSRLIGFSLTQLAVGLWRPVTAALLMGAAVRSTAPYLWPVAEGSWGTRFGALLLLIAIGAIVYAAVLATLWFVRGQPDGAEARVLAALKRQREKVEPLAGGV